MDATLSTLQPLIDALEHAVQHETTETAMIESVLPVFQPLLQYDTWLAAAYRQPHPDYYQQYLLYVDPEARFSIVSFVWGPGQKTPIHNHEVWGIIGVLQGAEISTDYHRAETGILIPGQSHRLAVGDIDWFRPETGDIHQVENAYTDQVSISIHIYAADIGQVERFTFKENGEAKRFISGYSNLVNQKPHIV